MLPPYVNIHTHRPEGRGIELRTAGIHPWHAGREEVSTLVPVGRDVQAIGETGLDFACAVPRRQQLETFRAQLRLARTAGLPVVVHCVRAYNEVLRELEDLPPCAAIFHGFTGPKELAREVLRRGWHLSFGERTFASPRTLGALAATPLDRLFVETDESETPIEELYARVAEARAVGVGLLRRTAYDNYLQIFERHERQLA